VEFVALLGPKPICHCLTGCRLWTHYVLRNRDPKPKESGPSTPPDNCKLPFGTKNESCFEFSTLPIQCPPNPIGSTIAALIYIIVASDVLGRTVDTTTYGLPHVNLHAIVIDEQRQPFICPWVPADGQSCS
jgi:hypothetical protein